MCVVKICGEQCYEVQPDAEGVLGYFRQSQLFPLDSSPVSAATLGSDSDDTNEHTDDDTDADSDARGGGAGDSGQHNSHGDVDSSAPGDDSDGAGNVDDWGQIAGLFNFMKCYILQKGTNIDLGARRYEAARLKQSVPKSATSTTINGYSGDANSESTAAVEALAVKDKQIAELLVGLVVCRACLKVLLLGSVAMPLVK